MSGASVTSLYSSMDRGEIKQDRLAINEKLQRHQSSRRSMNTPTLDDDEHIGRYQSSRRNLGTQHGNDEEEYVNRPDDFFAEDNDDASLLLMRSALHHDNPGNFMPLTRSSVSVTDKGEYLEVEMGRKRRHSANNSPVIDIPPSLPQVFVDLPSVMRSQNKEKTESSLLYILLCLALLVSYAFFLESCKLMNYGT